MKIGIDIRELRRGMSTGIGRYVRAFLRYASEHGAPDEFTLYGDRFTDMEFPWARRRVLDAQWPFYDHRLLPRQLDEDKIEVFLSPYYKAPWRCPCPYVVTVHDLMFLHLDDGTLSQHWRNPLLRAGAARFADGAAGVITVSEYSKREIQEYLGTDGAKIAVIPNAVPAGFAPADERRRLETLKKHGLPSGFILYVGGFKPSKNVGALLEAYAGLDAQARSTRPLLLVGAQDADHERVVERWGKTANDAGARFEPQASDEDLIGLYSSCGLCVVPSLFEGFGLPALEAMACGAPVLVSNRTSLPEVVAGAGEISEPDAVSLRTAMARLLGDPARREEMRRKGLERAKTFSLDSIGERMLSFLRGCQRAAGR